MKQLTYRLNFTFHENGLIQANHLASGRFAGNIPLIEMVDDIKVDCLAGEDFTVAEIKERIEHFQNFTKHYVKDGRRRYKNAKRLYDNQ